MSDEPTREFIDEDDRLFYEQMRSMSDAEMLAHMRQLRDGLEADGGKLARELGLTDEYIANISADIENFEKAIREEQLANQRLEEATRKMNATADRILKNLDPEYPDIIYPKGKTEH